MSSGSVFHFLMSVATLFANLEVFHEKTDQPEGQQGSDQGLYEDVFPDTGANAADENEIDLAVSFIDGAPAFIHLLVVESHAVQDIAHLHGRICGHQHGYRMTHGKLPDNSQRVRVGIVT